MRFQQFLAATIEDSGPVGRDLSSLPPKCLCHTCDSPVFTSHSTLNPYPPPFTGAPIRKSLRASIYEPSSNSMKTRHFKSLPATIYGHRAPKSLPATIYEIRGIPSHTSNISRRHEHQTKLTPFPASLRPLTRSRISLNSFRIRSYATDPGATPLPGSSQFSHSPALSFFAFPFHFQCSTRSA
jgi:hypothetical protein